MIELIPAPVFTRRASPRRITAGKLTGQKPALKMKEAWAIRARLEFTRRVRDLALFNLAIDSKLRGCDPCARSNFCLDTANWKVRGAGAMT